MTKHKLKAAFAPKGGKFVIWVQAPSGFWMLLHGLWRDKQIGLDLVKRGGYELVPIEGVLVAIEQQMLKVFDDIGVDPPDA